MVQETRRLLERPDLRLTATCVRVPVRRAHSEAVNVEFERPVVAGRGRGPGSPRRPGVRVVDDPAALAFPTPRDAEGGDDVLVGRIRRDPSCAAARRPLAHRGPAPQGRGPERRRDRGGGPRRAGRLSARRGTRFLDRAGKPGPRVAPTRTRRREHGWTIASSRSSSSS